jgi:ribosome silencing factor RsfS/YbeB/iojap
LAPIVFTTDRRLSLDIQKLQRLVVEALEDVKAQDILVFNTLGLSDMFDRVVLASGTSNRQTRSLAWSVVEKVKEAGGKVISVEGTDPGEWVLVDLGRAAVLRPGRDVGCEACAREARLGAPRQQATAGRRHC